MKIAYLVLGIITLIIVGKRLKALTKRFQPKKSNTHIGESLDPIPAVDSPFFELRGLALEQTEESLGLTGDESELRIYGIIMDWNLGEGIVTLTSFKTKEASYYLSTGGGVIGGGGHESVQIAIINYLDLGKEYLPLTAKIEDTPVPENNEVYFYFLTNKGIHLGKTVMTTIEDESSPWLLLFIEANKVLTLLNETSENE